MARAAKQFPNRTDPDDDADDGAEREIERAGIEHGLQGVIHRRTLSLALTTSFRIDSLSLVPGERFELQLTVYGSPACSITGRHLLTKPSDHCD
jgi:hypothetical protein